jgi:membrane-associated HD superfamily phosphohydrolase
MVKASSGLTTNALITLIVSIATIVGLTLLAIMVYSRREVQPLKIKSPTLLTLFIIANILTVALLCLVQLNIETCTVKCIPALQDAAKTAGYLLVCLTEPLVILSFTIRYFRIKKIFDAQKEYFEKGIRTTELISRYSELKLTATIISIVFIFTAVYMIIGALYWSIDKVQGYGILPTFALTLEA